MDNKRPSSHRADIVRAGAELLAPAVLDWLRAGGDRSPDSSEVIDDLAKVYASFLDGYGLAKALEDRAFWTCDSELVDILDMFSHHVGNAHTQKVKEWVAAENIRPEYAVGTVVSTPRQGQGPICRIYAEEARYVVNTSGDPNYQGGAVVAFEDVTLVEAEPA